MAYGSFRPAELKTFKNFNDETIILNTPAGYAGLFWGRVYDSDGYRIRNADTYFMDLAKENEESDTFKYWDMIYKLIDELCNRHLKPLMNGDESYAYQSGFGGDESDGLIDFWLPVQVPEVPTISFEIYTKKYVLKWEYSSGE